MSLILFPFFIYTAGKDNLRNLGTKKHSPAKIEVMPILRLIPNRLGLSESLLSQLSTKKSFLQAPCKSSQCIIHNTDLFVNCFVCHKQTALCIINAVNPSFLIMLMLRYNTWVTNKKQEKVLLWYNLIGQTTIERRTNSCARIIPQKLTIVNVCLSME